MNWWNKYSNSYVKLQCIDLIIKVFVFQIENLGDRSNNQISQHFNFQTAILILCSHKIVKFAMNLTVLPKLLIRLPSSSKSSDTQQNEKSPRTLTFPIICGRSLVNCNAPLTISLICIIHDLFQKRNSRIHYMSCR